VTKPIADIVMYGVVNHEGVLYENRDGRPCIYDTKAAAQRMADDDGDSVVYVTVHLNREPVFIRKKVL
jgi:hypothetical protein